MLLSYECNIDDKIIKHSIVESGKKFEALLRHFENPNMLHVISIPSKRKWIENFNLF